MINLLLLLVLLCCVGIAAAWVAENPGDVTMTWFDYRIDTSLAFLLLLAIAAAFVLAYAIIFLRAFILAPGRFSLRRSERHYRKGLAEITYSVAALAASDIATAEAHTRKAQKLLGTTPLTLLLSAQIARSQGDDVKTQELLGKMLDYKETEYLAARSLSDSASKQQLFSKALHLAQRAQRINPKEAASANAVISLHMRMGGWQEALAAIDKSARKGRWHRARANRTRALVHLAQGQQLLESGHGDMALAHAKLCLKWLPNFVPATLFAARVFAANGMPEKAIKLILQNWKVTPHPQLAEQLRLLIAREPKDKQIKWVKKLAGQRPEHPQSGLALAETAIKLQEWEMARGALKKVLENEESVQACKLMAYLEQGEFSDFDAAGRWLARSAEAVHGAHWQCTSCSTVSENWDAHCPACNAYDSMEWKVPGPVFAG
jgi:HemY protein